MKDVNYSHLESALLGLGHQEEDHDEGNNVQAGVETESTNASKGSKETRERHGKNRSVEEASSHSPRPVAEVLEGIRDSTGRNTHIPISLCVRGKTSAE